ncbi:MAG: hypothetical protein KOO65_08485 [Desulfobacterales bacterium]|nr:hypothetical protein [Desulfobacterales bacterium]
MTLETIDQILELLKKINGIEDSNRINVLIERDEDREAVNQNDQLNLVRFKLLNKLLEDVEL